MIYIRQLMDRLSYRIKFGVIALLVVMFSGFLVYKLVFNYQQQIQFSALEIVGAKTLPPLKKLLIDTQKLRGKTNSYLSGNRNIVLAEAKNSIQADSNQVEQALITANLPKVLPLFQKLKQGLLDFVPQAETMTAPKSFKRYSNFVQQELDLIAKVGDMSNLILDPDLDSYYLMDTVINKLPTMMEFTGQVRGLAAAIATTGKKANADEALQITLNLSGLQQSLHGLINGLQSAYDFNPALKNIINPKVQPIQQGIAAFKTQVVNVMDPNAIMPDATQLFSQGTALISNMNALYNLSNKQMLNLLNIRVNNMAGGRNITSIEAALFFALLLLVLLGIYASVNEAVNSTVKQFEQIGQTKDLSLNIEVSVKDELKNIADAYNVFRTHINQAMIHISGGTDKVTEGSKQLMKSSTHVNDVVANQLMEIRQVATAMNEMNSTVKTVAQNAETAMENVRQTQSDSANGTLIVNDAITSINQLSANIDSAGQVIHNLRNESNNIDSVLNVIRGIADQTNLLALNAAIEAARAGEQGRGFAVVADEVRTLASRTQESTQEIQTMIERFQTAAGDAVDAMEMSSNEAKKSVSIATKAGEALQAINEQMSTVTDMNTQIASAAEEQSMVGEEINRNISNINTSSDEISKVAGNNSEISQQLNTLSEQLETMVKQFKL